jgi:hypothetical protein
MGGIEDKFEFMLSGDGLEGVDLSRASVEVDGEDS